MNLKDKRIVIIGGSSGLGLATAKAAARRGAQVVIGGRHFEKLEKAKQEIGGQVEGLTLDVSDEGEIKAFFERVGKFDHLTTPGSTAHGGPFLTLDTASAQADFQSKFWGQYLAVELAPIRVNAVSPGLVDTPIYSGMPAARKEAMFKAFAAVAPVKRVGRPEEVAQTVLYLMTNSFTTGSTLYVDGGYLLR
jgi:NAD(P)-dependent dehydrogenase (short-subunit alcohol dehydrogenase family)